MSTSRQKRGLGIAALVTLISGHSSDTTRGTENNKDQPSVKDSHKRSEAVVAVDFHSLKTLPNNFGD